MADGQEWEKLKKWEMTVVEKELWQLWPWQKWGWNPPNSYIAKKKGLYTLLSRCIDPWNNREVWVDNYFSDDQLIFFLFGQEKTITQDHHICQHNQSTSSHSHGSIWKGCFLVIYWLLAELLRFSCLSQIRKKMISFVNYNIEFK